MEERYDCLAFEGNIYTGGLSFGSLSLAYIRLVNADTGQELARCSLGRGGKVGSSMLGSSRVLLFAKLFRGKDRCVARCGLLCLPDTAFIASSLHHFTHSYIPHTHQVGAPDGKRAP